jgi:integrase/recombinase XerD
MKMPEFQSILAPHLRALIALRQSLGYGDRGLVYRLAHFDRYLVSCQWATPYITRDLADDWVASDGPLKPISRAHRFHALRVLGRFLAQTFPQTYVPGPVCGYHQQSSFRPHIYTPAEIQALISQAALLTPAGSLRPRTYVTLFGLLYCSGLRISEALGLQLADLDLAGGLLCIRASKFHKSRFVPLHLDAVAAMGCYRQDRDSRGHDRKAQAPFFVNERGRACGYPIVNATFLALARRIGLRGAPGSKGPRIHDLRHTFAVHRLLQWYRDGGNVQARLPLLSTYLGHVSLVSTQVYLEITSELLREAARRFQAPQTLQASSRGGIS